MAGYRVYSFNWSVFADLTSDSKADIHGQLAQLLSTATIRKHLQLPSKLPKAADQLTEVVRSLFLEPNWYAGQSVSDVALRHKLLFAMFFDEELRALGLAAAPAWREFYENCSFELGAVLAGRMVLDHTRMKNGGAAYYKVVPDAAPGARPFWWFGNRPYRHSTWTGSNEEMMEFEGEHERVVYSIHSPEDVELLAGEVRRWSAEVNASGCDELMEMFADYEHCVEGVNKEHAGMLVENDY